MGKDREEDGDDYSGGRNENDEPALFVKRRVSCKGRSIEGEGNIVKAFWFVERGGKKCEKTVARLVFLVLDRKCAKVLTRQPWTSKHFPVNKIRSNRQKYTLFLIRCCLRQRSRLLQRIITDIVYLDNLAIESIIRENENLFFSLFYNLFYQKLIFLCFELSAIKSRSQFLEALNLTLKALSGLSSRLGILENLSFRYSFSFQPQSIFPCLIIDSVGNLYLRPTPSRISKTKTKMKKKKKKKPGNNSFYLQVAHSLLSIIGSDKLGVILDSDLGSDKTFSRLALPRGEQAHLISGLDHLVVDFLSSSWPTPTPSENKQKQ